MTILVHLKQFLDNATTSTVVSLSYVLFFYFYLLKAAVSDILIFGKCDSAKILCNYTQVSELDALLSCFKCFFRSFVKMQIRLNRFEIVK